MEGHNTARVDVKTIIGIVLGLVLLPILCGTVLHFNMTPAAHAAGQEAAAAMPAVPVTVLTLKEKPIRTWSEYSGRLQAVDYAEIRPEVSGQLLAIKFEDGQVVKKGDVLFVIDPRTYKAAVTKAEANLNSAVTNVKFMQTEFERAQGLVKSQAIAQRLYDERANAHRMAEAALAAAKAELERAKVDLDRAYVKAPISGRISRPEITVGNIVTAGPIAPLLTTIVSSEGIYADFEVDEQTYLQSIRSNSHDMDQERKIPVELKLAGGTRVYKGTIYSFDNKINTSSGTIRARAKFANEDGGLIPGMFVSIRLASSYEFNAILVPERAVGSDQNKKFVYTVDKDNKVVYRQVELGQQVEGQRIVIAGVKAGERVIVDGLQHVKPETLVDPKDVNALPDPAAQKPESMEHGA